MSTWLGIDIGTTAVKVAAVRSSYRKLQLLGVSSIEIAQTEGVSQAVMLAARTVMGDKHIAGDAIAVAIDGAKATVKFVELPKNAVKQVAEVLPFELEAQLPFDLSEAVFDHQLMQSARMADVDPKTAPLAVLVGVAKTQDVRERIEVVKSALGTEPERVGLGAFPLANLAAGVPVLAEGTCALVDIGTVTSDVVILRDGQAEFSRTLGLGTKGLPATAAKLGRELRTTLAAYRASGGDAPSRLFLCGGGAYVSGAEAFLASVLSIPVEVLPSVGFETDGVSADDAASMARFAKAVGLALSLSPKLAGLNLRRGTLAYERGFGWLRERVPVLVGLAATIALSFGFSGWAQLYAASKEKSTLETALSTVTKEVLGEETSSAERAQELLSKKTAVSDDDPLPHADAYDVMLKLAQHVPSTMVHDVEELDVQKGHVIVHGIVGTVGEAETIRANLKTERCFTEPKITRTMQAVGDNRQKYQLEFDIRCPEDQKGGDKKSSGGTSSPAASGSAAAPGGK